MEFLDLIKKRQAVRAFAKDKPVSKELVYSLLEAARMAPSAGNLQSRKVFVLFDRKKIVELSKVAMSNQAIATAPAVVVVCADLEKSESKFGAAGKNMLAIEDADIFAIFLWLAVANAGLGTCWIGSFTEEDVKSCLGIKSGLKPIAIFPIGFPADQTINKKLRLPLSQIIEKEF